MKHLCSLGGHRSLSSSTMPANSKFNSALVSVGTALHPISQGLNAVRSSKIDDIRNVAGVVLDIWTSIAVGIHLSLFLVHALMNHRRLSIQAWNKIWLPSLLRHFKWSRGFTLNITIIQKRFLRSKGRSWHGLRGKIQNHNTPYSWFSFSSPDDWLLQIRVVKNVYEIAEARSHGPMTRLRNKLHGHTEAIKNAERELQEILGVIRNAVRQKIINFSTFAKLSTDIQRGSNTRRGFPEAKHGAHRELRTSDGALTSGIKSISFRVIPKLQF